jgi:hypothetical protein
MPHRPICALFGAIFSVSGAPGMRANRREAARAAVDFCRGWRQIFQRRNGMGEQTISAVT